jgi:hypothetical protein
MGETGCGAQFDPLGRAVPVTGCDIARRALADAGVSYRTIDDSEYEGPNTARVEVGRGGRSAPVLVASNAGLDAAAGKSAREAAAARIKVALTQAGYPSAADPERMNLPLIFGVLLVFMVAATALYGPQAAALVELFPTRVRYTALSLPYHIGTGWVGGFLPFTAFAMVAATGDLYFGLWYPIVFTTISILVTLFFLPETRGRPLD